jgi:hypothetical protein
MANDCKGRVEDYDPFDPGNFVDMDAAPAVNNNRSRSLLALSMLRVFEEWAVTQGYRREPTKGSYEILRLRKKGEAPVLYFRRDKGSFGGEPQHATSYGEGTKLVQRWINTRKQPKKGVANGTSTTRVD